MSDMHEVIEDALTDAELPILDETPEPVEEPTEALEASPEPVEEPTETSPEVPSPAAPAAPQDDFEKKYGIPATSASGRENRIPYSRVKKITENAIKSAQTDWTKSLETSHVPVEKFKQLETLNKDYEGRLTKVAEFENIMMNDGARFLEMLSKIPAYQPFFNNIRALQEQVQRGTQLTQATPPPDPDSDMPQPDQRLSDGSMVYSLEGLKALNAWNRAQARQEVMNEVEQRVRAIEQRYSPMESEWEAHHRVQQILPKVQQQIAEARQWPLFNENEAEITRVLEQNQHFSLERAYQHVVWPKMVANKDQMRADLLKEIKQAPRATSVAAPSSRPAPRATSEPRSLEDVIRDAVHGNK